MLTGRLVYEVSSVAALPIAWNKPFLRPTRIVSELPPALEELVIALLSVDAMQRPRSAAEVIERLCAAAELAPQDDIATARSFLSSSLSWWLEDFFWRAQKR